MGPIVICLIIMVVMAIALIRWGKREGNKLKEETRKMDEELAKMDGNMKKLDHLLKKDSLKREYLMWRANNYQN